MWELALDMALREIRTPASEEVLVDPPAVGRLGEMERPDEVNAALLEFL